MAIAPGLNDSISEEGLWWLPQAADDKVAGTLTFSQETGAVLSLLGTITQLFSEPTENHTIHGMTFKGRPVTLLRAYRTKQQFNSSGLAVETYRAHLAVFGLHFADEEEAVFRQSWLRFEGIERWFGHKPFQLQTDVKNAKFSLEISKSKAAPLAAFGEYTIEVGSNLFTSESSDTEFRVTVTSLIGVRSNEPRSLNWHAAAANRLQQLASLCTGHFLPLLSLQFHMDVQHSNSEKPIRIEVDVYTQRSHSEAGSRSKGEDPLITAQELLAANSGAIKHWFEEYDVVSPAINLFFAVAGARLTFVNVRFLLAIQALEVFHRRTSEARVMDAGAFSVLKRNLVAGISDDIPESMREKLAGLYQFANEPSLMQRLRTMLKEIEDKFGSCPPGLSGPFARSLVDTRNYNTHFSVELERKALNSGGMHWATRRIVLLLTVLFLLRLGIPPTQIVGALEKHREFNMLWNTAGDPRW